ncbi:MAG: hypothetical protein PQ612_07435 [Rickettsiales bacterium]|nr:hypothetical protein [Pseudomonadota bacterium]MDA0966919.1 hypothetical protein [Pseudomonadota bacterium]MDG4543838.1 hypothetical protein [Rickettsiales bacterium]MDG4545984.1 hypothetical protein [Rickettsiales bacterium]MDG4548230.1 hypothetical protein [Rickettsiales bacterium]
MGKDEKSGVIIYQDISVQSNKSDSSHSAIKGAANSKGALGLKTEDLSVRFANGAVQVGWVESVKKDDESVLKSRLTRKRNEGHRLKVDLAMYKKISRDINNFMDQEFEKNNDKNGDILIVGRKIKASLEDTGSIATYFRSKGAWASIAQDLYSRDIIAAAGGFDKKSVDELEESSKKVDVEVDKNANYYKAETVEAFFEELGRFKFGKNKKNEKIKFDKDEQFCMERFSKSARKSAEDGIFERDESLPMAEQYRQYVYKSAIKKGSQMCVIS